MSDTIKDGGPAFPIPFKQLREDELGLAGEGNEGMSLRDWYAGMAMQGALSLQSFHGGIREKEYTPEEAAKSFYEWADAMLKAREVK